MKTCISTYSYSKAIKKGEITQYDCIDYTKKLGMDGVELVIRDDDIPEGHTFASYTKLLSDHAREIGLEVPILTMSADIYANPEEELKRLKGLVDIAADNNIPMLRYDITFKFRGDEEIKSPSIIINTVAPFVRELAEYAEAKGVKTCSENHGRILQDSDRMETLFSTVCHKNYGLLCDMSNFGGVDEKSDIAVSRLLQYVCFVHAKDAFQKSGMLYNPGRGWRRTRSGNYRRPTIFGYGDIPTFQILAALKGYGYDGWVSLEYEGVEDNLTALEIGSENLLRMLKDIENENFN